MAAVVVALKMRYGIDDLAPDPRTRDKGWRWHGWVAATLRRLADELSDGVPYTEKYVWEGWAEREGSEEGASLCASES